LIRVQEKLTESKEHLTLSGVKSHLVAFCLVVIFCPLLLGSCAYYNEKNPPDPSTISSQNVSWQRVSTEFFQPRCAVCHGQGGANIDVTSYDSVVRQLSKVQQQVLIRKSMPPDSPLTTYEQTLLTAWIAAGTPFKASGTGQ
jgi:uncharacterized membrane protein